MTIFTLENEPGSVAYFGEGATPFGAAVRHGLRFGQAIPTLDHWHTHGAVAAYINHSKWVVMCPNCSSAMAASKAYPEFHCLQCHNPENNGLPYAVIFPPNADEIEAALVKRPDPLNRNWTSTETVEQLLRDNKAHDL